MQNKKTLSQRLLAIYITFFIVLVASIAHSFLPNITKGYSQGSELSEDIVKSWASGTPRSIYLLDDVVLCEPITLPLDGIAPQGDRKVEAYTSVIGLKVTESSPGSSIMNIAFRSIGGNTWFYLLVMLSSFSYLAIVVLMFMIIHSLRRSIREESPLARRNIWMLRTIGMLTIFSELCRNFVDWSMGCKAAELLAGTQFSIDTSFHVSYGTVIMGILILFAAEVFAIGQNLSEEQKFTI